MSPYRPRPDEPRQTRETYRLLDPPCISADHRQTLCGKTVFGFHFVSLEQLERILKVVPAEKACVACKRIAAQPPLPPDAAGR